MSENRVKAAGTDAATNQTTKGERDYNRGISLFLLQEPLVEGVWRKAMPFRNLRNRRATSQTVFIC